jgi:thiamine biosynthesis protein ThiI
MTHSSLQTTKPSRQQAPYICLIHYHEVGLKGRNRGVFERRLRENVEKRLRRSARGISGFAPDDALQPASLSRVSGRLLATFTRWESALAAASPIAQVPGVARVSVGMRVAQDLDAVTKAALWLLARCEPWSTFKVDARRANTDFPIDSMELNRLIGARILEALPEKSVRLHTPDARIHVEMIEGSAFVYAQTFHGVGGLPVGSAGRVISLLSAGIDSPVASFRMMRRGARVTALHFSGYPETSKDSEHLVREILEILAPFGGLDRLAIVAFGSYQREVAQCVPPELRVIFYRRLMFAVAEGLAVREGAQALVTGESLGQVASQTLDNIRVIDAVAALPVLRPLIGSDKLEIIAEAQELGTFAVSLRSRDDCCTLFMPRNPETHAKLEVVETIDASLPFADWVARILDDLVIEPLLP